MSLEIKRTRTDDPVLDFSTGEFTHTYGISVIHINEDGEKRYYRNAVMGAEDHSRREECEAALDEWAEAFIERKGLS